MEGERGIRILCKCKKRFSLVTTSEITSDRSLSNTERLLSLLNYTWCVGECRYLCAWARMYVYAFVRLRACVSLIYNGHFLRFIIGSKK